MDNIVNRLSKSLKAIFAESLFKTPQHGKIELSPSYLSIGDTECVWFLPYREQKALLLSLKRGEEGSLIQISKPLYNALVDLEKEALVIPLPQSRLRVLRHGHNHSLLLVQAVLHHAKDKRLRLEKNNLIKIRETRKQAKLSRAERLKEQKGSFHVRKPEKIKGQTILLVDDIVTTGASLLEAQKTLLKADARRVVCVALAH